MKNKMSKRTLIILGLAFALLLTCAAVIYGMLGVKSDPDQMAGLGGPAEIERSPAPDFTVYDSEGNEVKLSDYFGKPIVLNFWASWCEPCRSEMPDFNDAYIDLGQDIQFLMVNMTSGREIFKVASSFVEEQGFSFPVFYDMESDAAAAYGISSLPTTIFIDAEGYTVGQAIGAISGTALRQGIETLLLEQND